MNVQPTIIYIIKRTSYTEAQKRATYKYMEKHKEELSQKNKMKYKNNVKPFREAFQELARIQI
jgi:hypothetical protein